MPQYAELREEEFLPSEFWAQHERLTNIRDYARGRTVSPDALLHIILAQISAHSPFRIVTGMGAKKVNPGLSYFTMIVCPSGVGKNLAMSAGREYLSLDDPGVKATTLGTGEGIIGSFLDTHRISDGLSIGPIDGRELKDGEKYQKYRGVLIKSDEGAKLINTGKGPTSILLETLRTMWTGTEDPGQNNATQETSRSLAPGSYQLGMIVGIQMGPAYDLIKDDELGTPQRFGWVTAMDPGAGRFDDVEALPWSHPTGGLTISSGVIREVEEFQAEKLRGRIVNEIDSQRPLMKLKLAGLYAALIQSNEVGDHEWAMAEQLLETSEAVRSGISSEAAKKARESNRMMLEAKKSESLGIETARQNQQHQRSLDAAAGCVHRHLVRGKCDGGCTTSCTWRAVSTKDRQILSRDDLFEYMVGRGLINATDPGSKVVTLAEYGAG